jgi:hypothetical protein
MKSSAWRCTGNVAHIERKGIHTGFLVGMSERSKPLVERVVAFQGLNLIELVVC